MAKRKTSRRPAATAKRSPRRPDPASAIRRRVLRLAETLAKLRVLAPDRPELWQLGPVLSETEVDEIERSAGVRVPDELRAVATTVGDGGASFVATIVRDGKTLGGQSGLRDLFAAATTRITRPFPLDRAWFDPAPDNVEALKSMGNYTRYRRYVYRLPRGARADDGTVVLGVTANHCSVLLVVTGPDELRGTVWIDGRGYDGSPVLPGSVTAATGYREQGPADGYLAAMQTWASRRLREIAAERKRRDRLAVQVDAMLSGTITLDEVGPRGIEIADAELAGPAPRREVLRVAAMLVDHHARKHGDPTAGDRSLAGLYFGLGHAWTEMLDTSLAQIVAMEGHEESRLFEHGSALTHLRIAGVALDTLEVARGHVYRVGGGGAGYGFGRGRALQMLLRAQPPELATAMLAAIAPEIAAHMLTFGIEYGRHRSAVDIDRTLAWLRTMSEPLALLIRQAERILLRARRGDYRSGPPHVLELNLERFLNKELVASSIDAARATELRAVLDDIAATLRGVVSTGPVDPDVWW